MKFEEIRHNISSLSDKELIELSLNKTEYRDEAIQIADSEIKRRKLESDNYRVKYEEILNIIDKEKKETEDLTSKEKILLFFSFFIFLFRIIGFYKLPHAPKAIDFFKAGYIRKFEKTIQYKLFSRIIWIIMILFIWGSIEYFRAEQRRIDRMNNKTANHTLPLGERSQASPLKNHIKLP